MNAGYRQAFRKAAPANLLTSRASRSITQYPTPPVLATSLKEFEPVLPYTSVAAKYPLVPKEHLKAPIRDECQILQLSDDRLMPYAEYGSKAPDAHPIIFCHGIPDCRLDACLLPSDQQVAEKLNIRWIAIDRPGIGLSSMQRGRTVLGWVDDLRQLIDHLKLPQYHIFSVSGGTGYALAAVMLLPREQIKGVGIMVGVAPWDAGMEGMSLLNRLGYVTYKYYPQFFRWILNRWIVPEMQQKDLASAEQIVRKEMKYFSAEEKEDMKQPGVIPALARLWVEVYRQGAEGHLEDSKTHTSPWGFEIEDVGYPGVKLWYGKKDVNTPPQMGRYLATRLPDSVLKEYEGKTHFTMWHHTEEILMDLLRDD